MNPSKVIFTDLDGTLLNDKGRISVENKNAIIKALDYGHKVYIATGRPYAFAKNLAQSIDIRVNVVSFNGAVYETDKLHVNTLNKEQFHLLRKTLSPFYNLTLYKTKDKLYYDGEYDPYFGYDYLGMKLFRGSENCDEDSLIKVLFLQGELGDGEMVQLVDKLRENFEVHYYPKLGFELNDKGINKGTAVTRVMNILNIDIQHSIVFGDDLNDLSMFDVAGTAVATENAVKQIKEKADLISTHCNDSAIANGLAKLEIV